MTLAELHERIGWQLEGRLQIQVGDTNTWSDVTCDELAPAKNHLACRYRRRPDAPTLPNEVWLIPTPEFTEQVARAYPSSYGATLHEKQTAVRYIRADGIIDGARLECRYKDSRVWGSAHDCEYRFKP